MAPRVKTSRTCAGLAALAVVGVALAAIGWWLLFSNFALWDDEGYILMAAREYHAHGRLYDFVYSQYGPAFHAAMDAVQNGLRLPVDHTLARWLTLGCWLATAVGCAALAWRGTASRALALFTLAATFLYLHFLPDAPFHPGPFIVALLAVTTSLLARLVDGERWSAAAAVAGATSAVLLLTKINVGVFHLAAIGAWALLHADSPALRRLARPALMAGLPLLAAAVMHTLITETWIHIYLAVFSVGAVTVIAAVRSAGGFSLRHLGAGATAAVAITLLVLGAVAVRGTSAAGLLDGALLGPLRHPGNYSYAVDWRPGTLVAAALSLGFASVLPWLRRRDARLADRIIVIIRLAQAGALGVAVVLLMHGRVIGAVFSYVAPLVWTWVVPLEGDTEARRSGRSRALLALILLLQYLHAYPVGGSQQSWGTFLLFPLVALGLGDLRRRWLGASGPAPARGAGAWRVLSASIAAVAVGKVAWTALESHRRHAERTDLALPGASGLRLEENRRIAYRVLALNASVHADLLFSLPGMYSFNLWTGLPAPTARNTTLWFNLLTEAEQRDIIDRIKASPRACVIVQEHLVQLMQAGGVAMGGPLHAYLHEHFALAFRVEGFAFLVHSGRAIAPLALGRVAPLAAIDPAAPDLDRRIEFTVVGDDTPVASLAIAGTAVRLDARHTRVTTTATDRAGNPLRPAAPAPWPWPIRGVTRAALDVGPEAAGALVEGAVLQLLAADGRMLQEVRITAP
jgi:hypothetical protein